MDHGKLNHGFGLSGVDFVVAIEATRKREPREGPFNDPALWQDNELSGIATFDDRHRPGKHCRRPTDQFAGIAAIGKDLLNAGDQGKQANQERTCSNAILNARRMDHDRQKESQGVDGDVLFSPLGFLACVITALPPFPALLTERESMIETDGSLFRPALSRAASRKAFMALAQRPSSRQRRKQPYTVCQGGNSFGKNRHWQPVFTTYSMPLTSARKSCLGGRPRPRFADNGLTRCGFSFFHCSSVKSLGYIVLYRSLTI